MIERDTVFELEVTVDNFEAVIGNCIRCCVACINVRCAQRANSCTLGILINREVVQSDISRSFVYIAHRDLKSLRGRKATRVSCGNCHRDRVRFFVIERDTLFELEIAVDHFETVIGDRVSCGITRIWVGCR